MKNGTILFIPVVLFVLWPKYFAINFGSLSLNLYTISCFALAPIIFSRCKKYAAYLIGSPIALLIILETGVEIFSTFTSSYPDIIDYPSFIRYIIGIKLLYLIAFVLVIDHDADKVVGVLLTAILISCLVSAYEFYEGRVFADILMQFVQISGNEVIDRIAADKTRDGGFRAQSTFDHPIILGISAVLGTLIYFSFLFKKASKIYPALCVFVTFTAAVFSGSRVIFLGMAVAFSVYAAIEIYYLMRRAQVKELFLPIISFGLFLAVYLTFNYAQDIFHGKTDLEAASSEMRKDMWYKGLFYMEENIFFGSGFQSSAYLAGLQIGDIFTIDNHYLSIMVDFGIFGIIVKLMLGLVVFLKSNRLARISVDNGQGIFSSLCAIIVAIFAMQSTNSIPFGWGYLYFFCGVVEGAIFNESKRIR